MAPEMDGSNPTTSLERFEKLVDDMGKVSESEKESIDSIRTAMQVLRDMRAEIGPIEESDRLCRLEILVKNLMAMFRNVFGEHALIGGRWIDLAGNVDATLMRDKAGYDRHGNLISSGRAIGIGPGGLVDAPAKSQNQMTDEPSGRPPGC